MNTLHHAFSIDIETGDVDKTTGPILSIGITFGNILTGQVISQFYVRVSEESQPTRKWSESTREWWVKVSKLHLGSYLEITDPKLFRLPVKDALLAAKNWISKQSNGKSINVFGRGPEFDNEFVDVLCKEHDITLPWRYTANQSHRTIEWLEDLYLPEPRVINYDIVEHHALIDSQTEFLDSSRALRKVLSPRVLPLEYTGNDTVIMTTYETIGVPTETEIEILRGK